MSNCEKDSTFEASPYTRISFHLKQGNGTTTIYQADCGLSTAIDGLKSDMSKMLGAKAEAQKWFYNGTLLEGNKTLKAYSVRCTGETEPIIQVEIVNV